MLRQAGHSRRHPKSRLAVRRLAAERRLRAPFCRLQRDVKNLSDLHGCRELISIGLPRPARRSTYNRDVEAVHGAVESEFYGLERFRGDVRAFLGQAWSDRHWFNYLRGSSGQGSRNPYQWRAARAPWGPAQSLRASPRNTFAPRPGSAAAVADAGSRFIWICHALSTGLS